MTKRKSYIRGSVEDRFWPKVDKVSSPKGCWQWMAYITPSGYGQFAPKGTRAVVAHRVAWELTKGVIPGNKLLDHICHNKSCVNPEHLRIADKSQNAENLGKVPSNNKSGYRGVSWRTDQEVWRVAVKQGNRQYGSTHKLYELHIAAYMARELRNRLFTHNELDRL